MWRNILPIMLITVTHASGAPIFDFQTVPAGGAVTGMPGQTVGWGYSITNPDPSLWLVTSALTADPFALGIPISIFDFPIVPPMSLALRTYDGIDGLLQVAIFPGSTPGTSEAGLFTVSAQWFTADPFVGGMFVEDAAEVSAPYSLVVSAVPEPGTIVMLGVPLLLLLLRRSPRFDCALKTALAFPTEHCGHVTRT